MVMRADKWEFSDSETSINSLDGLKKKKNPVIFKYQRWPWNEK